MRIVVYYEDPDEQDLAEDIVSDVHAVAKFAADATGNAFRSRPVEITAHVEADFSRRNWRVQEGSWKIDDLKALKTGMNPALPHVIQGGQAPVASGGIQSWGGQPASHADFQRTISADIAKIATEAKIPPAMFKRTLMDEFVGYRPPGVHPGGAS